MESHREILTATGPQRPYWIVAFVDYGFDEIIWPQRFLKRGFRHCFAVTKVDLGWYVVDPGLHGVETDIIDDVAMRALTAIIYSNGTALKFRATGLHWVWPWPEPLTCVSFLKMTLGIRSFSWTPYQLYKTLIDRGATNYMKEV